MLTLILILIALPFILSAFREPVYIETEMTFETKLLMGIYFCLIIYLITML